MKKHAQRNFDFQKPPNCQSSKNIRHNSTLCWVNIRVPKPYSRPREWRHLHCTKWNPGVEMSEQDPRVLAHHPDLELTIFRDNVCLGKRSKEQHRSGVTDTESTRRTEIKGRKQQYSWPQVRFPLTVIFIVGDCSPVVTPARKTITCWTSFSHSFKEFSLEVHNYTYMFLRQCLRVNILNRKLQFNL
jgi:hypothetical protein